MRAAERDTALAILVALRTDPPATFRAWAQRWLDGRDRTRESALACARVLLVCPVHEPAWVAARLAAVTERAYLDAWTAQVAAQRQERLRLGHGRPRPDDDLDPTQEITWALEETIREALVLKPMLRIDEVRADLAQRFPEPQVA